MSEHWPHPTGDVSETAGWWVPGRDRTQRIPPRPTAGGPSGGPPRPPRATPAASRRPWGRRILAGLLILILLGAAGSVAALAGYVYVAMQLPPPETLQERALNLSTSLVLTDRNGELIGEIADPQSGRRQLVRLSEISPWLIRATVATEDPRFWQHPGFDPIAIVRAIYQAIREGEVVSGASTIPQQLVRNLIISPERTLRRKIKEAVLAAEITRRYPREQILEIYLNTIYYGNLAYGVEAAARTYFGKPAKDLTLAEASFLAGLPQAPALYDPFTPEGRERALRRQRDVLRLMVEAGFITPEQAEAAAREMQAYPFQKPPAASPAPEAPHFALYVLQWLEQTFGLDPQTLHRGGLRVETTLDLRLQRMATRVLREHLAKLADKNVHNGAVVILDPRTGEILAMVGSPDYNDAAHGGQINMAIVPRQPGSSIKPLTYLVAFEKGWTPATLIWDVPTRFPDGPGRFYEPVNYDRRFHGPVTVRYALGNSYNVPAVKALAFVGLPAFLQRARDLGITTLTRPDYGLSLTLGGGEVPLLEMVGLYAAFANEGRRVPPVPVRRITDAFGRVLYEYTPPPGQPVMRPEHAYLITHILSDNEARKAAFGPNSPLKLSRPAAAKTGTTNDFRDNWTLGYSPDLVVGVWVGNADNSEMKGVTGITGAAPVWHDVMEEAHRILNLPPREFRRPPGIIELEICLDSGTRPSPYCPPDRRRVEVFAADQPPPGPEHDLWQLVVLDGATGLRYAEGCPGPPIERVFYIVPEEGRWWAEQRQIPQPPSEVCTAAIPQVIIRWPNESTVVRGIVPVQGTVWIPDFAYYNVEWGIVGADGVAWQWLSGPHLAPVRDGQITVWDTSGLPTGWYALRVTAFNRAGQVFVGEVRTYVDNGIVPTPTPIPTVTPTPLPTPTPEEATPAPTPIPLPTLPLTPLPTP
ncbi:MAG: PBP1A family penicillin-binding protein [Thermoflexus hugenholtzii]|jgi:1A family penicillin-binding protein|uniref:transglycosylase domain-containing protein n=1 Tax=Thermoflexus TaxID=1495649 RepID=UPI001C75AE6B|nr:MULTISPECIES: PBP1A family penicillin-binding protein [Thermoflexus]QWK10833.1 MAG: PBP1A family penicillin-binding protein [Thermoflexus hugenholtzii]